MAENTSIEWAHDTLNLWWGCTKVSDGCKHCYAETLSNRWKRSNWGPKGIRQEVMPWRLTLNRISKAAKASGVRRRVFCQSMSDTFEGPETMGGIDSENWKTVSRLQDELLDLIPQHPELDFLLLTKRPENVLDVCHRHDGPDTPDYNWKWPSNLWIGTSVEDQATASTRIPSLLEIPAKVRFLSCEPLLGPVDLTSVIQTRPGYAIWINALRGIFDFSNESEEGTYYSEIHIDWVICGGESGPKARPMNPDWARSLRDQCVAAGVPFFFKQWGEWRCPEPDDSYNTIHGRAGRPPAFLVAKDGTVHCTNEGAESAGDYAAQPMIRVGKKAAGRLLDGRTWDQLPQMEVLA